MRLLDNRPKNKFKLKEKKYVLNIKDQIQIIFLIIVNVFNQWWNHFITKL